MPVVEIEVELKTPKLSAEVDAFLKEADRRCDVFFDSGKNRDIPNYIPGDPFLLYAAIEYVTQEKLTLGSVFCEWGSGFGVGACMAAMQGYEAYGIEHAGELVALSRKLVKDYELDVQILESSYFPEGYSTYYGHGGYALMRGDTARDGSTYEGMDLSIEEIDLFYIYPWPDEQELILKLFDAIAAEGAILIVYYGDGELCIYRKE